MKTSGASSTMAALKHASRFPTGGNVAGLLDAGNDIGTVGWPPAAKSTSSKTSGSEPVMVHGTIHGPDIRRWDRLSVFIGQGRFADDYHVYAVEWGRKQSVSTWTAISATRTPADLPQGTKWVYDHPFFMILNLAVGGEWRQF
jgi:beta-glucanase (GH16 family)